MLKCFFLCRFGITTLVACLMVLYAAQAQEIGITSSYQINRIDSRDGLSHNTVFSITQDRQGYMWFGTADGLNRFDGYSFTIYRHSPDDPASLANNTVRRITEDQRGNLWLRTGSNIDRFDRASGVFFHYPSTLFRLLEDQQGNLWASAVDGLYIYNPLQDVFEKKWAYDQLPGVPVVNNSVNRPLGLMQDNEGFLWVSTGEGHLYKFDLETGDQKVYTSPWQFTIVDIEDEQNRMILLHNDGVGFFDPAREVFESEEALSKLTNVLEAEKTKHGLIWFASSHLYQYNPSLKTTTLVALERSNNAHLSNTIWTLFQDRSDAFWMGTLNGVYRIDPNANPFSHISHDPADPGSLSNNIVMSLLEDKDEMLWVGTLGHGVNRLNLSTSEVAHFPVSDTRCNNLIWKLLQAQDETIWIGTNTGLCSMNPETHVIRHWRLGTEEENVPVYVIQEDDSGIIWAGGATGLYSLDPSNGQTQSFKRLLEEAGGSARITGLLLDSANKLWIGTTAYELYQINLETGSIQLFRIPGGNELKDGEGLWEIQQDISGELWIGSDRGLFLFDPEDGSFKRFDKSAGFPSDFIYSIKTDNQGFVWASTNTGLVRFLNPLLQKGATASTLDSLEVYQAGDGIGTTEFNRRSAFKGRSGRLYFGGTEGLAYFKPAEIQNNPHIPPVVLTSIQVSSPDTTRQINPFGLSELHLTHRDYSIAFEFAGLSYMQPEQNQYAYKMTGVDPSWQHTGTRRFAQYTNLNPGQYTFNVKASNNDGVWNQSGMSLTLHVAPPFWMTWWFLLSSGVLALTSIVGLVRFFSTRKLRKQVRELELQQRIQHERERISRDLHDNVGAQLSTIISGVELMRLSANAGQRDKMASYIDAVDKDTKKTLSQLRETIWTLQNDQVTFNELHQKVRDYLQHLQPYHPDLTFTINGIGEDDYALSPNQALGLFRIMQEAVHNAIKHADCNNITVNLETDKLSQKLTLLIADNGSFKPAQKEDPLQGLGIAGIQYRVQEIGATFDINTQDGTQIQITLPVAL